jgi:hypothetical protein
MKCKGANAASPRAKVQKWETTLRVAGGSPGWLVAGRGCVFFVLGSLFLQRSQGRAGLSELAVER